MRDKFGVKIRRKMTEPEWRGTESLEGKTILVQGEQGLGDCIQFARYAPLLADQGANVILEVPLPAVTLLKQVAGVHRVISYEDPLPEFDCYCSLLSLPLIFKTDLNNIPRVSGPISPSEDKIQTWSKKINVRFPDQKRPKVGLVWSGGTAHKKDRLRSIPLADFIKYLPDHCDYICLQKEIRTEDLETLQLHPQIMTFEKEIEDFLDTAALCLQMDVIVSVDTSVAHLAGTLNKSTWILIPSLPDWRWLWEGNKTPWYPTAKLFRQQEQESWVHPLKAIQHGLKQLSSSP